MEVVKDDHDQQPALTGEQKEQFNKDGQEVLDKVKDLNITTLDTVVTIMFRYGSASLPQGELFIFEQLLKKIQRFMRGETVEKVASIIELDKLAKFIMQYFPKEPGSKGQPETPADVAMRLLTGVTGGEAILGFVLYLSMTEGVEFKTGSNPNVLVDLVNKYIALNGMPKVRDNYTDYLKAE